MSAAVALIHDSWFSRAQLLRVQPIPEEGQESVQAKATEARLDNPKSAVLGFLCLLSEGSARKR